MQIIDLEQKLQTELKNFDETKPTSIFFIDYGQPSEMSCKLAPSESDTIFISIVHRQHKESAHKTCGDIDVTYTVWADECDMPASYHALAAFYKNEQVIDKNDDLVETMSQMIKEIFDAVEQDN
jgi:hypothetical protein